MIVECKGSREWIVRLAAMYPPLPPYLRKFFQPWGLGGDFDFEAILRAVGVRERGDFGGFLRGGVVKMWERRGKIGWC